MKKRRVEVMAIYALALAITLLVYLHTGLVIAGLAESFYLVDSILIGLYFVCIMTLVIFQRQFFSYRSGLPAMIIHIVSAPATLLSVLFAWLCYKKHIKVVHSVSDWP